MRSRKNFSTYRRLPRPPRLHWRRSRRWRIGTRLAAGVGAIALVAAASVPGSLSGFAAKVSNGTGSGYGSGLLVLSSTANGATCTSSPSTITADANSNCAGSLFPPVLSTTNSSSSITVNNNSAGLTASSVKLTSASSCGVLTTPDTSTTANNPTVITGGVTTATSTPLTGGSSFAFDGSTGYLQTTQSYANPQTYSISAWFQVASGSTNGGTIVGAGSHQGTAPNNWDRLLYLDSSGHVNFGVYGGGTVGVITSSGTYNNGAWHFVVATASSSGTTIYVDGSSVASSTSYTSSQDYGAWWSIGWSNVNNGGWTNATSNPYFSGDIADAAIYPTALTATQVTTLDAAGSQTNESSRVLADAPTAFWPMQSTPTSTTGTMENLGTTFPDSSSANNTATIEGQVTSYTSSKWSDGSSAEFESAQSGFLQTSVSQTSPATAFSIAAWFKIAPGAGGTIVGMTNKAPDSGQAAADTDRAVWIDSAGKVVFGTATSGSSPTQDEITSPNAPTSNTWHFMVATFSTSTGMALYIDGTKMVSNTSYTSIGSYAGAYWHVGWGGEVAGSWADAPTSAYFDGEMTDVAIYNTTALSQTQVNSLNAPSTASQAGEQTALNATNPTYDWALLTAQTTTFCTSEQINIAIENDQPTPVYCIDPYQTSACPTGGTSVAVSTIAGSSIPLSNISPGSSDVIKITMSDSTNVYDGMHFAVPLTLSASSGTFTASLLYPATTPQQTFQG